MKKKKIIYKLTPLLVCLFMLFSLAPLNVFADTVQPKATSITITPSNKGSDATEKLEVAITYDTPIKAAADAKNDFAIAMNGNTYSSSSVSVTVDSSNSHKLLIDIMTGFAIMAGHLTIKPANNTGITKVTNTDGSASINWTNLDCYAPNGLALETVSSVAADTSKNINAKVTKKISSLGSLRAMVHFLFLKNGIPVGQLDSYGASVVAHYHDYLNLTGDTFAPMITSALNTKFGQDYTFTTSGSTITAEAKNSTTGDVLNIRVFAYPQDRDAVKAELTSEYQLAKTYESKASTYTSASFSKLSSDMTVAKSILSEQFSLQTDVDNAVSNLKSDIDALVKNITDSTSGITVTGQLPLAATTVSISAISTAYDTLNTYLGSNYNTELAYDISVLDSTGVKLQPLSGGSVTVSIPLPQSLIGNTNLSVFYIASDGTAAKMNSIISADGKTISFTTTHFSEYIVAKAVTATSTASSSTSNIVSTTTASSQVSNPKTNDAGISNKAYSFALILISLLTVFLAVLAKKKVIEKL